MSQSDHTEHIARISFGKDSLKMLDVIITRGLPLDGVTTTDVWATDTVRAELPDVLEAKERIEEKLWQMYRIEVDHLCARNKDGTKRTYEQMFYHVPVRRSQTVQVERERETGSAPARSEASRICGTSGVNQTSSVSNSLACRNGGGEGEIGRMARARKCYHCNGGNTPQKAEKPLWF